VDVYVIGARPGALGSPRPERGRAPQRRGEAVVDGRAKRKIGDSFVLGDQTFQVVGRLQDTSVWGGVAAVFITLEDAQRLLLGDRDGATTILTKGFPRATVPGTAVLTAEEARSDLKRPVANAITTVDIFRALVWLVATAIIGSLLYVSALERTRDFAVCKAFGTRGRDLIGALTIESLILSSVSAVGGFALSRVLLMLFPSIISFPATTLALLPLLAAVAGVIGSMAGARRALSVDPATAFGGP
jgi:putative ABC transport system permease protein